MQEYKLDKLTQSTVGKWSYDPQATYVAVTVTVGPDIVLSFRAPVGWSTDQVRGALDRIAGSLFGDNQHYIVTLTPI
jgi:hypothetical protein